MARPDFLCIGTQKAGTSWLFETLREHPDVWTPPVKELHFFDHLFVEANRGWTKGHLRRGVRRAIRLHVEEARALDIGWLRYLCDLAGGEGKAGPLFSEKWYEACFRRAPKGSVLGDVTPEYCTLPVEGVAYVRDFLPKARLIWIIRDPVDRALSQLRMNIGRRTSEDLTEAEWRAAADHPDIANRGDYRAYLPRWLDAFGAEAILFLPFGDIAADPGGVMARVEAHLGLSPFTGYRELSKRVHPTPPLEPPRAILRRMEEAHAPQREVIRQRFGADFLSRT